MADEPLFNQSLNASPLDSQRLVFATPIAATENMTFAQLITYLEAGLGFLKQSQNLADVNDPVTSLTNLGGYSSTVIDAELADKADIYTITEVAGALKANNAASFTPSSDYNPATKKYIDDKFPFTVLWAGRVETDVGAAVTKYKGSLTVTAVRDGNGTYTLTHSNGSVDYMIYAMNIQSPDGANNKVATFDKSANTITTRLGPDTGYSDGGDYLDIMLLGF